MSMAFCWKYQAHHTTFTYILFVSYSRNGTPHCTCQNCVTDHIFVFVLRQQPVICWKALKLCLAVSKITCDCAHEFHTPCKNCADVCEALHLMAQ